MTNLSADEQAFINRMADYVAKGASFDAAAAMVIADDNRIADAFGVCSNGRKSNAQIDCREEFGRSVYRSIRAAG